MDMADITNICIFHTDLKSREQSTLIISGWKVAASVARHKLYSPLIKGNMRQTSLHKGSAFSCLLRFLVKIFNCRPPSKFFTIIYMRINPIHVFI